MLLLGVAGIVALNVLAYRHAYLMTHFVDADARTKAPERLSRLEKVLVLLKGISLPRPENSRDPSGLGLDFDVHRIAVDADVELEAWHIPSDPSKGMVLMFHGYAVAKDSLLSEAEAFHQFGYSVLLVDFRGSGGSNQDATSVGFHEAADVAAAVNYAREQLQAQRLVLFGQSMGAAAVLRAIAVRQVAADLVILEAVFDSMLNAARNRFRSMRVPSFPNAELLVFWGGRQVGFSGFAHNPSDYAEFVNCPVLMLHGTDDPRATLGQARTVYERLPGTKEFVAFDGVRHESYLTVAPGQWKAAVATFLTQLADRDRPCGMGTDPGSVSGWMAGVSLPPLEH
jgi:pimeloyl-ACP methyl ester carboxylesterase